MNSVLFAFGSFFVRGSSATMPWGDVNYSVGQAVELWRSDHRWTRGTIRSIDQEGNVYVCSEGGEKKIRPAQLNDYIKPTKARLEAFTLNCSDPSLVWKMINTYEKYTKYTKYIKCINI